MIFQQEVGKNSDGKDAGFDEVPMDFDYFYGKQTNDPNAAFPKYYGKYILEEEISGE